MKKETLNAILRTVTTLVIVGVILFLMGPKTIVGGLIATGFITLLLIPFYLQPLKETGKYLLKGWKMIVIPEVIAGIIFWFLIKLLLTERAPNSSAPENFGIWMFSLACIFMLYVLCLVGIQDGLREKKWKEEWEQQKEKMSKINLNDIKNSMNKILEETKTYILSPEFSFDGLDERLKKFDKERELLSEKLSTDKRIAKEENKK